MYPTMYGGSRGAAAPAADGRILLHCVCGGGAGAPGGCEPASSRRHAHALLAVQR